MNFAVFNAAFCHVKKILVYTAVNLMIFLSNAKIFLKYFYEFFIKN